MWRTVPPPAAAAAALGVGGGARAAWWRRRRRGSQFAGAGAAGAVRRRMGRKGISNGASWSGTVLRAHSSNTVSVTMEGATPDASAAVDSQLPPGLSKQCLPQHLAVRSRPRTTTSAPRVLSLPPARQRRLSSPELGVGHPSPALTRAPRWNTRRAGDHGRQRAMGAAAGAPCAEGLRAGCRGAAQPSVQLLPVGHPGAHGACVCPVPRRVACVGRFSTTLALFFGTGFVAPRSCRRFG